MPSVFIPVPEFPDVPNLPGVPPLVRDPNAGSGVIGIITSLLTGDNPSVLAQAFGPQWGVFDSNNQPLVIPDSVTGFTFSAEARLEKYPIEGGSFADYNKVFTPFEPRVMMTKSGSPSDRTAFLQALMSLRNSFDVCNVVTPEITYVSVNCNHFDYDRKAAKGATLIEADVHFEQVIQTATATFSNTAQPSGAGQTNDGQVQALGPTPQQEMATINPPGP